MACREPRPRPMRCVAVWSRVPARLRFAFGPPPAMATRLVGSAYSDSEDRALDCSAVIALVH